MWANGFTANITINNTGSATLNGWAFVLTFPSGQQLTNGWNGNFTQQGTQLTVTNVSYNGTISAGGNTSIGFNATYTSSNTGPTSFSLNGTSCTLV